MYHTCITSQILVNMQPVFYFSLWKWHFNKHLYETYVLQNITYTVYYLECTDRSKRGWTFPWLLKWLSKDVHRFIVSPVKHVHATQNLVKLTFNLSVDTYCFICPALPSFQWKLPLYPIECSSRSYLPFLTLPQAGKSKLWKKAFVFLSSVLET